MVNYSRRKHAHGKAVIFCLDWFQPMAEVETDAILNLSEDTELTVDEVKRPNMV